MIITVDIGNSHQNYALFDDSEKFIRKGDFQDLDLVVKEFPGSKILVSSVDDEFLNQIPGNFHLVRKFFTKGNYIDMPTQYTQSIGEDRLAVIYYLYKYNQQNKVIIDSGSFTTIDFVDSKGHKGGFILPGLQAIRSTFTHGKHLKKVEINMQAQASSQPPTFTQEAMEQGMLASFHYPILGIIRKFHAENIFLTGGSGQRLAEFLKTQGDFKMAYSAELLHRSLCFIAKRMLT